MRSLLLLFGCALTLLACEQTQPISLPTSPEVIYFDEPAGPWEAAFPLGNGRIGAMVFGRKGKERIALNEETFWSGKPKDGNNPGAKAALPKARKALLAGKYEEAIPHILEMQGPYSQSYLPLGDLWLDFQGDTSATYYERTLDIATGLTRTKYMQDGTTYERELFVSHPDQVMLMRLTAKGEGSLDFDASLTSKVRGMAKLPEKGLLYWEGRAPGHADPSYLGDRENAIRYDLPGMKAGMWLKVLVGQEHLVEDAGLSFPALSIRKAKEVVLVFSAKTSFKEFLAGDLEADVPASGLEKLGLKSYASLKEAHVNDYQALYQRVNFDLGFNEQVSIPIDERLIAYDQGGLDSGLESLMFQFGRYLMISASRPGGIPMNLQGIWNQHMRPPWSSNYTININTEMNYWPAEVCNLAELHGPLLDFIDRLAVRGKETARINYGAKGWVAHHNSDIWAPTNPVGDYGVRGGGSIQWANWPMSGGWLSQHSWEHFAYGRDTAYLRERAYPIMKGAAEFMLDWLIKDQKGRWVTAPATSPENTFKTPDGQKGAAAVASTMDMAIIWDLFSNCIKAAEILEIDEAFRQKLASYQANLFPLTIGQYGQLQEWSEDWDNPEDKHRHVSHLFALHPGKQIHPLTTPELAEAAKKSLELRGDDGTGWSKGWKINFWARLLDGDHAYKMIRSQLRPVIPDGKTEYMSGGGTYPNLFDAHPPFQIDGNFGATAGIAEMLLQSHLGEIHLLPAVPSAWGAGAIQGLRARGGYTVDISWEEGKMTGAVLYVEHEGFCRLRYGDLVTMVAVEKNQTYDLSPQLEIFKR